MRRSYFSGLLIALLVLLTLPVFGQQTGSISGTVSDSTGAVIPNAKVVLMNQATQVTRETVTNGSGVFYFAAVPSGTFSITVTQSGFNTWEQKEVSLTQGGVITLSKITLQVGETKEQVQVEASAEMIATESPHTSQTLNQNMIS